MKKKAAIDEKKEESEQDENLKGIPDFWGTIFRNVDMLCELVEVSR